MGKTLQMLTRKFRGTNKSRFLFTTAMWSFGGGVAGIFVGAVLVGMYGWTIIGAAIWLPFGFFTGLISGGFSYIVYGSMYLLMTGLEPPVTRNFFERHNDKA
ncbi:MAG: hypothetical protein V3V44_00365 [Anaerolineales bacterium]